jgi:hypothetical protein
VGVVLIAALLPASGDAAEAALARNAEESFAEGLRLRDHAAAARPHFAAAAQDYEGLRRRGADSAALYRNLGHAYLLAGDLPHAILSYRRGLRVTPWDRGLRDDLAAAREQVAASLSSSLGRPPATSGPPWWPRTGSGPQALLAAALYVLAWPLMARWLMIRQGRSLACALVLLAGSAVLASSAAVTWRQEQDDAAHPPAVIAADGVLLRRGDGMAYPPRYDSPLRRGVESRLLHVRGSWLQLELAGGQVGWVPRNAVVVDRDED